MTSQGIRCEGAYYPGEGEPLARHLGQPRDLEGKMLTPANHRKPRQSWLRRVWPFPVIGSIRAENPRVGGSIPSQATTAQALRGVPREPLWLHFEHVAGGLTFLALLLPAAPAPAADGLTLGVLGVAAADLATTQWGYATVPGARDANPLIQGPASAVAVKAVMTAGVLLLDREFQRHGHRRAGKVLKVAAIVVWGSCAAWNVRQVARHGGAR